MKLCNGVQVQISRGQPQQWHWGCNDCQRMQQRASNSKPPALRWTDHCADRVPFGAVAGGA